MRVCRFLFLLAFPVFANSPSFLPGLAIIRKFLSYASTHPLSELQHFTANQYVLRPRPYVIQIKV